MKINYQYSYPNYQLNFCSVKKVLSNESAIKKLSGLAADTFEFQHIKNADLKLLETPIKNDEEFSNVFGRVIHDISNDGQHIWFTNKDFERYKNIDKIDRGLIPYCGFGPGFKFINMFLSGRLTPEKKETYKQYLPMRENSFIDVIRALDYSLKNLDKKYGKYQGIVYRQGYMSESPNEYISTTTDSIIAIALKFNNYNFSPERGFSVIRVKNGHKIKDFQRQMNSVFADKEEEILMSYKTKYKKIAPENMDEQLIKARERMASQLFIGADKVMDGSVSEKNGYTKKDLLDLIDVYEEI